MFPTALRCVHCGCPLGSLPSGTLRVEFNTLFKFLGGASVTITFDNQCFVLSRGYYKDFEVPNDGKDHVLHLACSNGLFNNAEFSITIKAGENKKISVIYNDGHLLNKWSYHSEMLITK